LCLRRTANWAIAPLSSMPSRENEVKELNLPSFFALAILLASVLTAGAGVSTHLQNRRQSNSLSSRATGTISIRFWQLPLTARFC